MIRRRAGALRPLFTLSLMVPMLAAAVARGQAATGAGGAPPTGTGSGPAATGSAATGVIAIPQNVKSAPNVTTFKPQITSAVTSNVALLTGTDPTSQAAARKELVES